MNDGIKGGAVLAWTALLGASAVFGSYFFACVFPFAALATIAALTLPLRPSLALVFAVWATNQFVGYAFRDYPHTLDTIGWGLAIGVAAFAALAAARRAAGSARLASPRALVALAAAFAAYEGVLYLYALAAGGLETFAPGIVASIGLNDLAWFAALAALRLALARFTPRRFAEQMFI